MVIAAWLVWKKSDPTPPLAFYVVQLAVNASWTPLLFGVHELGFALIVIGATWMTVLMTPVWF